MKKICLLSFFLLFIFALNAHSQEKPAREYGEFTSQKVETNMQAGKTYSVSITFKNTGGKTWEKGKYWIIYTDPRMNARNNNVWGTDSVAVKKNVKKGSKYEFKFKVTAPQEAGIYFFSWMMCGSNGTFGTGSELQQITVSQ